MRTAASATRKDKVMDWASSEQLAHLIATYGYVAIGTIVALESMGLPLPGESVLVLAALYATRHNLSIVGVVASAATGAVLGDNIGYWIGREFGYRLLLRYGGHVGLSSSKIKLGQYLFLRHGGKVVFFGRFVAVLRLLAAILAGVNRMDWRRFLLANAAGAILWASGVGFGAYVFGRAATHVTGPLSIALLLLGLAAIVAGLYFVRAHEAELEAKAERALPGPLPPVHRVRARPSH
jgi:membrane protein DedA with SNARE-associated domain